MVDVYRVFSCTTITSPFDLRRVIDPGQSRHIAIAECSKNCICEIDGEACFSPGQAMLMAKLQQPIDRALLPISRLNDEYDGENKTLP